MRGATSAWSLQMVISYHNNTPHSREPRPDLMRPNETYYYILLPLHRFIFLIEFVIVK